MGPDDFLGQLFTKLKVGPSLVKNHGPYGHRLRRIAIETKAKLSSATIRINQDQLVMSQKYFPHNLVTFSSAGWRCRSPDRPPAGRVEERRRRHQQADRHHVEAVDGLDDVGRRLFRQQLSPGSRP